MPALRTRGRRGSPQAPGEPRRPRAHLDDRGSSALELAILFPAILVLLFSSIQVAMWFLARDIALNAAQEAVTAQRGYDAPDGAGTARANSFLARTSGWLVNPQITVTRDGDDVRATVTGTSLPFLMTLTVSQTAHGRVERFTTDVQP
jgi:Flp pilus assembly protein TadG